MKIHLIVLAVVVLVAITAILVLRHPAFGRRMTIKVTVTDNNGGIGTDTKTFTVGGSASSESTVDVNGIIDKIKPYIIPIIVIILGLLLALAKAASGGKKKSKKKGGKKR